MDTKLDKILAEISAGELIDKITILEIKKIKITGVRPPTPLPFMPATNTKKPRPAKATPIANLTGVEGLH